VIERSYETSTVQILLPALLVYTHKLLERTKRRFYWLFIVLDSHGRERRNRRIATGSKDSMLGIDDGYILA